MFNKKIDFMIARIRSAKKATQKTTGSYKYDDCYDECIEIVKKYRI